MPIIVNDNKIRIVNGKIFNCCFADQIVVRSQSWVDDDLSVRVNGVRVFDTQYNTSWYKGEDFVSSSVPPFPPYTDPDYWRIARITRADAQAAGTDLVLGSTVNVDTFDGWGGSYRTAPWEADIYYGDCIATKSGGTLQAGPSIFPVGTIIEAGIVPGWSEIEYFPVPNDLTIDANGIGRSGIFDFGFGWVADTMAFWVDGVALASTNFTIDYQWQDLGGGIGNNKHGMSWWANDSQHGAGLGGLAGTGWIGTWDAAFGMVVNGTPLSVTTTTPATTATGVWIYRRIIRSGSSWTITDGTSFGNSTYGRATVSSSATVGPLVGITLAGAHRIPYMKWSFTPSNYYSTGPHFISYYPNGSFTI